MPPKITDRDNREWTKADFAKAKKFPRGTSLAAATAELLKTRMRDMVSKPSYLNRDEVAAVAAKSDESREPQVDVALSNAMGLGGHNGCVLFGRA